MSNNGGKARIRPNSAACQCSGPELQSDADAKHARAKHREFQLWRLMPADLVHFAHLASLAHEVIPLAKIVMELCVEVRCVGYFVVR